MPLRFSSTVLTATTTAIPSPILYLDATDYDGSSATWTAAVGSDATLQNTPTYNLSSPTYFSFNGVNETATTADLSASFGTESVTLEVWVRTSSDNGVIIAKQGEGGVYHLSVMEIVSGNLKVGSWNGAGTTSATVGAVTRNAWQHYVLTYDDATNTLTGYLDAATSSSTTLQVDGPTSLRKFVLCASDVTNMGDGTALSADIGLFRVWNRALTASQVQEIYEENLSRFGLVTSNLVLRLDPDLASSYSGSGSTWYDIAGTADNITLVNSPAYTSGTPSYFTFNGTNQYGNSITTGVVNSTAYTKSAWFYLNGYQDNNIFSGDGHFIYMGPQASIDKKIYCGHADWPLFTAYPSTATINLGTWYNVTLTFSTTNGMTLYINGVQDSTYTVRKTAVPGTRTANIAAYSTGNLLNGRVGKVLCYSAELTAGEVLQNFNADKATYGL